MFKFRRADPAHSTRSPAGSKLKSRMACFEEPKVFLKSLADYPLWSLIKYKVFELQVYVGLIPLGLETWISQIFISYFADLTNFKWYNSIIGTDQWVSESVIESVGEGLSFNWIGSLYILPRSTHSLTYSLINSLTDLSVIALA